MTRNEFIAETAKQLWVDCGKNTKVRIIIKDATNLADELEYQKIAPWVETTAPTKEGQGE